MRCGSSFAVELAPGDGKVILLLPHAIGELRLTHKKLQTPEGIARGEKFVLDCEIQDTEGKNIPAHLPIELTLTADNGLKLPGSGFYAAEEGKFQLQEILPTNLPHTVKNFTIVLRCLASGKNALLTIPVRK